MSDARRSSRSKTSLHTTLNESKLGADMEGADDAEEEQDSDFESSALWRSKIKKTDGDKPKRRGRQPGTKARVPRPKSPKPRAAQSDDEFDNKEVSADSDDEVKEEKKPKRAPRRVPNEDQLCELYKSVRHEDSSVKTIAKDWITSYQRDKGEGLRELINFVIQSAGSLSSLSLDQVLDPADNLIEKLAEKTDEEAESADFPLSSKLKHFKKYKSRFIEFWSKLVQESLPDLLYDKEMMDRITQWLADLSKAKLRSFRMTATHALISIVNALIVVSTNTDKELDTANRVLEAEQNKSRPEAKKVAQLEHDAEEAKDRQEELHRLMRQCFTGMFVHRYRDVDWQIRLLCMESLGKWMEKYPTLFIADSFLKYVGWCLNDKNVEVRKQALRDVVQLYKKSDKKTLDGLALFTTRFKPRFAQMTSDSDSEVAASAVELMTALLRTGRLDDNDGENVPSFLWDRDDAVRQATLGFVYEDTFAKESKADDVNELEEDLRQVLNIFDSWCPVNQDDQRAARRKTKDMSDVLAAITVLVDSFWDRLACLKNWSVIVDLLMESQKAKKAREDGKNDASDEERQAALICLLLACATKATKSGAVKGGPKARKEAEEKVAAQRTELTTYLIKQLPKLLTTFQADVLHVQSLVQLVPLLDLDQFAAQNKKKEFTALLKALKSVYMKNTESVVFRHTGKALRVLATTEFELADEAKAMIDEIAAELMQTFDHIASEEKDSDVDLTVCLKRMAMLSFTAYASNFSYTARMDKILQDHMHHQYNDEIIGSLLHFCVFDLGYQVGALDRKSPEKKAMNKIREQHAKLMAHCEYILSNDAQSVELKNDTWLMVSDLLRMFGPVLNGTPLEPLRLSPTPGLSKAFQEWLRSALEGKDTRKDDSDRALTDKQLAAEERRRRFIANACSLALKIPDPWRSIGAIAMAFFKRLDPATDLVLKEYMKVLRQHNQLLSTQADCLIQMFAEGESKETIRELAKSLVLFHGVGRLNFSPLFERCMAYIKIKFAARADFFDALKPFVTRTAAPDALKTVALFDKAFREVKWDDDDVEDRAQAEKKYKEFVALLKTQGAKSKGALSSAASVASGPGSPAASLASARSPAPAKRAAAASPVASSPALASEKKTPADAAAAVAPRSGAGARGRAAPTAADAEDSGDELDEKHVDSDDDVAKTPDNRRGKRSRSVPMVEEDDAFLDADMGVISAVKPAESGIKSASPGRGQKRARQDDEETGRPAKRSRTKRIESDDESEAAKGSDDDLDNDDYAEVIQKKKK